MSVKNSKNANDNVVKTISRIKNNSFLKENLLIIGFILLLLLIIC